MIASVRTALAAVVAAVPGINEVAPYPPDQIAVVPAAWLGDATATIKMGSAERWWWDIDLTVAVMRKGGYAGEAAATEGLLDGVMARLRANITLAGTVSIVEAVRFRQGVVGVGGTDYLGFTLSLRVQELTPQTLSG